MEKLFAVMLGGRAPKANTELHDVVFVTGARIEDTYAQLLEKWFGAPDGLHLDSWLELDVVDGYRITLSGQRRAGDCKLYFVNLGAYRVEIFTELHANGFYVAPSAAAAKQRAKESLFQDDVSTIHKDDLHDVDDCLALETVGGLFVVLTRTDEMSEQRPNSAYHLIPKPVVAAYRAARSNR